ncbi:hypothetical protein PMZ80_008737 [Knufia obscura]|uniref:Urea carboxylase n=1 Tax=Knufia obscura TaxID=1635080 RepID=A0ABR0RFM8_9EURO|nr:hypothetical protein PMZ80_008737 [Knufia obscura]
MKVLIANRGEIAVRLVKACKSLGYHSTAIYSDEDGSSMHVRLADEAVALDSSGPQSYLDSEKILSICLNRKINTVIPGYGFLSENSQFAKLLHNSGIVFAGPTAETITEFGLKHRARELAIKAGVPIVPGTGIVTDTDDASQQAEKLGYPVMVKATAGGGGMGLKVCHTPDELRSAISVVRARGEALFKDSGLFLEKYVESGRHIEGQIFGNGQGDVLWFGERECSVQRRHQKVLEESPSPYVLNHPELREELRVASTSLAASIKYKSAGTVEFLVDDETGKFYFLEMNTRLQVEHGVTELCYQVDLVDLMLSQAHAEVEGRLGLTKAELARYERLQPQCHAIEVRLYAENPADDYRPAPGLFTDVFFPAAGNVRIDTWLESGSEVTPSFDPLIAKVMVHSATRAEALKQMQHILSATVLHGPPTNLEFLEAVVRNPDVVAGYTLTNMLSKFHYTPSAMEVKDGGLYTTIQDWPGRPNRRSGVPVSGPMDSLSFRISNLLVGNDQGTEGMEITYAGPQLVFHQPAVIALCGAEFDFSIGGQVAKMWTRHFVPAGAEVIVGSHTSRGCRAYLAILGGFPSVGSYLGSKSTTPSLKWGGYQGRTMRAGDWLQITRLDLETASETSVYTLPPSLIPPIDTISPIYALPGPYDTDEFITPEGRQLFFDTVWKVAFSSSRGGVRLDGPAPQWSRKTGGEGGSHPSNMLGYGYPQGGMSFTGDAAVLFTADSPVQSGFICPQTVLSCQLWRVGQLKAGDEVRFSQCSWEQAMALEKTQDGFLRQVMEAVSSKSVEPKTQDMDWEITKPAPGTSILCERAEQAEAGLPRFVLRQAGDRGILCDFGSQVFDLTVRAKVQQLVQEIAERCPRGFHKVSRPHTMSVFVAYEPAVISQAAAMSTLVELERRFSSTGTFKSPGRIYHLPMVFDAAECDRATQRYMETQRPYATYLPDNIDFIRRNNGLEKREDVLRAVEGVPFLVVASSGIMGLPILIQVDPRQRLTVPKTNPSRTTTPAGALGIGGNTSAIYPVESPGGYMLWGITLPGCPFDTFGRKPNYAPDRPWLFNPFDQVIFHNVPRAEFDEINRRFQMGLYEIESESAVFDLEEYTTLVDRTAEEVRQLRERQQECAALELEKENELLQRWNLEKKARGDGDAAAKAVQDARAIEKGNEFIVAA